MMTLDEIERKAVDGTAYEVRLCVRLAYEKGRLDALREASFRIQQLQDSTLAQADYRRAVERPR